MFKCDSRQGSVETKINDYVLSTVHPLCFLYVFLGSDSWGVLSEDFVFAFRFRIPPLKRNSGICWLLYLRQKLMSVSSILLPWLLVKAARAWLHRRFVISYSASGLSSHPFPTLLGLAFRTSVTSSYGLCTVHWAAWGRESQRKINIAVNKKGSGCNRP